MSGKRDSRPGRLQTTGRSARRRKKPLAVARAARPEGRHRAKGQAPDRRTKTRKLDAEITHSYGWSAEEMIRRTHRALDVSRNHGIENDMVASVAAEGRRKKSLTPSRNLPRPPTEGTLARSYGREKPAFGAIVSRMTFFAFPNERREKLIPT